LQLEIQGLLRTPDGDLTKGTRTFVAQIAVISSPEGLWEHVNHWITGFSQYPLWAFIFAAIGALVAVISLRRRRNDKPDAPSPHHAGDEDNSSSESDRAEDESRRTVP
jgi:hypothetical protein